MVVGILIVVGLLLLLAWGVYAAIKDRKKWKALSVENIEQASAENDEERIIAKYTDLEKFSPFGFGRFLLYCLCWVPFFVINTVICSANHFFGSGIYIYNIYNPYNPEYNPEGWWKLYILGAIIICVTVPPLVKLVNVVYERPFKTNPFLIKELCMEFAKKRIADFTDFIKQTDLRDESAIAAQKSKYITLVERDLFKYCNKRLKKWFYKCAEVEKRRLTLGTERGTGLGEVFAISREALTGMPVYDDYVREMDDFGEKLMNEAVEYNLLNSNSDFNNSEAQNALPQIKELLDEKLPESSADAANSTKPETPAKEAFSADDHTPRMQFCRRCGKKLDDNLEICSYCGTAVIKEKK